MQISIYIFASSFAVTLCTVTEAWMTKYDLRGNYDDHKWGNQVSVPCIKSEAECLHSSQCCNRRDVCLMDAKLSMFTGRRVGVCRDLEEINTGIAPTKLEGDTCEDSSECLDGCCIIIRRHRYGVLQVCAKENGPFMCVTGLNELTRELTRK